MQRHFQADPTSRPQRTEGIGAYAPKPDSGYYNPLRSEEDAFFL